MTRLIAVYRPVHGLEVLHLMSDAGWLQHAWRRQVAAETATAARRRTLDEHRPAGVPGRAATVS
jgi:hypothetical protein